MRKLVVTLSLALSLPAFSQVEPLWLKISGKWQVSPNTESPFLYDLYSKSIEFGYSDPINHNALITLQKYRYDKISIMAEVYNPVAADNSFTVFFNLAEPSFREYFGFRFHSDKSSIYKVSLIKSEIKNNELPQNAKNNFKISEIQAVEYKYPFSSKLKIEIFKRDKKINLHINGKKIISAPVDTLNEISNFGFYHRNNLMRVYFVSLTDNDKEVFADTFGTDRIKRSKINASIDKK